MVMLGCNFSYSVYRPASLKPNVPNSPMVMVSGAPPAAGAEAGADDATALAAALVAAAAVDGAALVGGAAAVLVLDEQPATARAATATTPMSARCLRAMNMDPP